MSAQLFRRWGGEDPQQDETETRARDQQADDQSAGRRGGDQMADETRARDQQADDRRVDQADGSDANATANATANASSCTTTTTTPPCFVIVYNVAKRHNVGNLLRSCTAFGVKAACLVGSREFNGFGAHGAAEHVALRHYNTLEECVADLRAKESAHIVGVEIDPRATPVHAHTAFRGPTAFMLGNEGDGLNARQRALCDDLVYIAQHGPGTASLNVTVAASIVLHQFATVWAGYPERAREGAKYVVAPRPQRVAPRGVVPGSLPQRPDAAEAARAKAEGEAWLAEHGGLEL